MGSRVELLRNATACVAVKMHNGAFSDSSRLLIYTVCSVQEVFYILRPIFRIHFHLHIVGFDIL